ncbi:unnamed protein product [Toxocara canis]|uniref:Uncharacterized protein n=1 Tax=Toxocara canis TaxID=6265 RepID=A0A3P7GSY9_TOXCA|nr:unnamed protein product [Toxocara canis]
MNLAVPERLKRLLLLPTSFSFLLRHPIRATLRIRP